jgi:predicted house-cleaning noncanonical NTP pyrophosphatase (MazG superfamily)
LNEPTIELCGISGDANSDDLVDILDVVLVISYIVGESDLSQQAICNSDSNEDGNINVLDVVILVSSILD